MPATGAPRASFCILALGLALGAAACGKAPLDPSHGPGTGAPPSGYQVVDLGDLGGGWTVPEALTDDGRVVGTSITASGVRRGFLYENGVMRALAESGPFARNEAQAINPAGQIAGIESGLHAVLIWDGVTGAPRRLDTGASAPPATRIIGFNERGDVLVRLDNNHYDVRATLWRDGVAQELGGLGTRGWTYANAWNSRGEVIGSSWVRNVAPTYEIFHPFVWENGVMRDLGVLATYPCGDSQEDCSDGSAADINEAGVIVGTATNAAGAPRVFVWENGVMRELDAFRDRPTLAHAINDRGQILGTVGGADPGFFVWDNGVARRVGSLGGATWAWAFGENGEVVGESQTANGELHAFVWQNGRMTDLGPGSARAINGRGDIMGIHGVRGILWRKTTQVPRSS